jgi:molecular chaperone GrpE
VRDGVASQVQVGVMGGEETASGGYGDAMDNEERSEEIETTSETTEELASKDVEPAGGPASSADDDGAVQVELGHLQEEIERLRELYLRKLADFDNYRKRQEREMADFRRAANADVLRDFLAVVDNLERALGAPTEGAEALRAGVELVLRQCQDVLARHGVKNVDPEGQPFDPALHEAIHRVESPEVTRATVSQVFQKGYVMNDRLLRPALVVVAMPADSARDGEGDAD